MMPNAIAIHEASHAFMAEALGLHVRYVQLGDSQCFVFAKPPRLQQRIDHIRVLAAGAAGESALLGRAVGGGTDDEKIKQLLHGNDDAEDIVWFAPSSVMNPSLPAGIVEKALEEDAAKARAEFLNVWREDLSDFIPVDVIDAATDWGVSERPPLPSSAAKYVAWADAAGGTGRDSFALAIAHKQTKDRVAVLDLVRERKPRFVASAVVAEFAAILRQYRITEVWGDAFAGGFHADAWADNKIRFKPAERTTSENYLALLPLLTQPGRTRLLHDHTLRHQLAGLERRVHAGDRESVSHADMRTAHDDVSAAAAGAIVLAASRPTYDSSGAWIDNLARAYGMPVVKTGKEEAREEARTGHVDLGIPMITFP
jgi:hypothetical protein